jgi:hypothetical protein
MSSGAVLVAFLSGFHMKLRIFAGKLKRDNYGSGSQRSNILIVGKLPRFAVDI